LNLQIKTLPWFCTNRQKVKMYYIKWWLVHWKRYPHYSIVRSLFVQVCNIMGGSLSEGTKIMGVFSMNFIVWHSQIIIQCNHKEKEPDKPGDARIGFGHREVIVPNSAFYVKFQQVSSFHTVRVTLGTKDKYEKNHNGQVLKCYEEERYFLCIALLLNEIYLPTKFSY